MPGTTTSELEQLKVEGDGDLVKATFPLALYELDDVYGAAYVFISKCFMFLDLAEEGRITVSFKARAAGGLVAEQIAGEFANELLAQSWRRKIAEHNRPIIEAVTAAALSGALGGVSQDGASSPDEFDDMDFSDEAFEDPLGIALSWEEKYGKGEAAPPVEGDAQNGPPPREDAATEGGATATEES